MQHWFPIVTTEEGRHACYQQASGAAFLLSIINGMRVVIELMGNSLNVTRALTWIILLVISLYVAFAIRKYRSRFAVIALLVWSAAEFVVRFLSNQVLGGVVIAIVLLGAVAGFRAAFLAPKTS